LVILKNDIQFALNPTLKLLKMPVENAQDQDQNDELNKSRNLPNSLQAINCDYIVRINVKVDASRDNRLTSLALLMNNQLSSHHQIKNWEIVIDEKAEGAYWSSRGASKLYELYEAIIKKGSGLVKIPYGLRLQG